LGQTVWYERYLAILIAGFKHYIIKLPLATKATLFKEIQGNLEPIQRGNLEKILRENRILIVKHRAKEDSLDTVLTGHHLDDQYETVLQRFAWGSSLMGLGGILNSSNLYIRPLLDYSKARLCIRSKCRQGYVLLVKSTILRG
jgi:tRNA(Ile)-lysidine synthase TilS/MesJ